MRPLFVRWRAAGVALALVLSACAAFQPAVTDLKDSISVSLVNALTNTLAPGVNKAFANAAANATVKKDLDMLSTALPWAQKAVDFFGPYLKVSPTTIAIIDAEIVQAEADLKAPPTTAGDAVLMAKNAWNAALAALNLKTT